MTADDLDPRDAELLSELGAALDAGDSVPESAILAARSAIAWRRMDEGLLELMSDSLETAGAGDLRDAGASRVVSFRSSDLTMDVEVGEDLDSRTLQGQVSPAGPSELVVRSAGEERRVPLDGEGRFRVSGLRRGPVSLRVEPAGAWPRAFKTDWMAI